MGSMKKRMGRWLALACLSGTALGLPGCGQVQEDEHNVIVVEQEAEPVVYDMAVAALGDVHLIRWVFCTSPRAATAMS